MERKWVYEVIAETVPPFSWLPRKYNILAQLIAMEIAGAILWYIFALPKRTLLYGSISIFVVVLWSFLILQLAPTIRGLKHSLRGSEREFLERYRSSLFSAQHYEAVLGLIIFLIMSTYMFYDRTLMNYWFGERASLLLILFVLIFTLDVSYRMGIVLWVSLLAAWRSVNLKKIIERGPSLEYIPYVDFWALQRLDSYNIIFVAVSLPMLVTTWQDRLFTLAFFIGGSGTVVLNLLSIATLRRIPWLPSHVYDLAENSKFAYVGTSDGRNPHITPVSFVFDGLRMFFMTSIASKKLKNIERNPRISFLVDARDPENIANNRAVLFVGSARVYRLQDLLTKLPIMFRARRIFMRKYPEYTRRYKQEKAKLPKAWQLTPLVSRILIEIKPRKIVYWKEVELPAIQKPILPRPAPSLNVRIPKHMHKILMQSRIGYVCTVGNDAQPHVTPVFYVYDSNKIYFTIREDSKKARNIAENPKVSFVADVRDPINPFKNEGVMVSGTAAAQAINQAGIVQAVIEIDNMIHWRGPKFERIKFLNIDKSP
ncbi:MAG: pyridoxamine 5'-phosphate oxidase family protein [Euryarchaeota archaeon]|nr:pyridoxamine 5'-phosphate oxidase family protein [Euryarchaeota archaeon]